MKKQVIFLLLTIFSTSCSIQPYRCGVRFVDFKLYPVTINKTAEYSSLKNWYHSEFQNEKLNFTIEFDYTSCDGHYDELKEFYQENYPDENTFTITCNKDISNNIDTIKSGEDLKRCFNIVGYNISPRFNLISYLLSEKNSNDYLFDEQYYTFKVSLTTSDSIFMQDSCIIRKY